MKFMKRNAETLDLKRMRIAGWRDRAEDGEEWSKLLNRPRHTQGCRVDRRRRRRRRRRRTLRRWVGGY
jgi:hypothetical protein